MKNIIPVTLLLLLLFVAACKKQRTINTSSTISPSGKFLSLPPSSPSYLQRVAQKIHQQNLSAGFLPQLEKEEGIPVWNKAQVTILESNNITADTLVLLPLVRDGARQTSGFIVCKVGMQDAEIINLVRSRYYAAYGFENNKNNITANVVALQSMLFDKKIFGDSTFELTDNRLFSSTLPKRTAGQQERAVISIRESKLSVSAREMELIPKTNTVCYTVTHKGDQGNLVGAAPGEDPNYYYTEEICVTDVVFVPTTPSFPTGGSAPLPGGAPATGSLGGSGSASSKPTTWYNGCQDGKLMLMSDGIKKTECVEFTEKPAWKPTELTITYNLTEEDKRIIQQIKDEDKLVDKMLDAPPGCYGTNSLGNINRDGTLQHWLIQYDYLQRHPGGLREYSIPESSKGGLYRGRADIVNTLTNEIFEIKPIGLEEPGQTELMNYVVNANKHCPTSSPSGAIKPWSQGIVYETRLLPYPPDPTKKLEAKLASGYPGVIVYKLVQKGTEPNIVFVPQNVLDKIKNLVRELKKNTDKIEEKILVYLRNHPEIVEYIKVAAVGAATAIIVGTIIEDIVTLGAGIADDWASFMIATKLIRFARLL
ncbi:MAG: hypothetical protein ACTHMM_03400 [Agriterribacter sp.]